jgi:hypothetical protein
MTDAQLKSREQQLELVVKFTMKWLEEQGCIAVSGKTRQACVSDFIDDKDGAILDVACERALAGTLNAELLSEMRRTVEGFNYRSLIDG